MCFCNKHYKLQNNCYCSHIHNYIDNCLCRNPSNRPCMHPYNPCTHRNNCRNNLRNIHSSNPFRFGFRGLCLKMVIVQ